MYQFNDLWSLLIPYRGSSTDCKRVTSFLRVWAVTTPSKFALIIFTAQDQPETVRSLLHGWAM